MKRVMCVMLIVSIAYTGCADKKQSKVTVVATKRGWIPKREQKSNAVLMQENVRLKDELREARKKQSPEFLLTRLDVLEEAVLNQIGEVGYAVTSKRKEDQSAEVAIEAQRVTIEVLQKLCRLYEDVLGSQRTTIELLKKICRLYEDAEK